MRTPRFLLVTCLLAGLLAPSRARAEDAPPARPKHCVGWGIAGAVGGMAVGYYAAAGLAVATGAKDIYAPRAFIAGLAGEAVGAVAGPMATCPLSGDPRIVPAATFVAAGAMLGAAAVGAPTYLMLDRLRPYGDEGDNPVLSGVTLLFAVATGAVLGGLAGYGVSEAREPASVWSSPSVASGSRTRSTFVAAPLITKTAAGFAMGLSF